MAEILLTFSNGLDRVRAYAHLYLEGVEKGLGCLCAAFAAELDTLPEALRADLSRFFAKHVGWLERILSEGVVDGTVRAGSKPALQARMIVAALEGALMMERVLDGPTGFTSSFSVIEDALRPLA